MNTAVQPYQQQYQQYQPVISPRYNSLQYSPMPFATQPSQSTGIYTNPGFGAGSCCYAAQTGSEQLSPAIQQLTNVVSQLVQLVGSLVNALMGAIGIGGATPAAQAAPQSLLAGGSTAAPANAPNAGSQATGGLLDTLTGWLDTGAQFLEDIGNFWDKASPYVDMGYDLISKGWDFATDWLGGGVGKVAGVFKKAVGGIGSFVSGLF